MGREDWRHVALESPLSELANSVKSLRCAIGLGPLLLGCQQPSSPALEHLPVLGGAWQQRHTATATERSAVRRLPIGAVVALASVRWTVRSHTPAGDLRCSAVPVGQHWLLTSAHCIARFRQDGETLHPIGPPVPAEISLAPRNTTTEVAVPPDRNGCGTDLMALRVAEPLSRWAAHRGINQVKPDERLHLLDTGSARPRLLSLTVTCQAGRCPGRACNDAIATASAPVTAGTSGGGVYDRTGLLVGLVSRTSEDGRTVFITDLATVTDWLSALPGRTP